MVAINSFLVSAILIEERPECHTRRQDGLQGKDLSSPQ